MNSNLKTSVLSSSMNNLKIVVMAIIVIIPVWLLYSYSFNNSYVISKKTVNYTSIDVSDEAFLRAATYSDVNVLKKLISFGANINATDDVGRNAVFLAVMFNTKPDVVNFLSTKVNINHKDNNGYTPLMMAINASSSITYIQNLIKNKADVNAETNSGISVLMIAAANHTNEKVIEILIKNGAKVNYRNANGVSALMLAAKINPNYKVIDMLLKYGANTKHTDKLGITIYDNAKANPFLKNNTTILNKLK